MAANIQILENGFQCFAECTHNGSEKAWHGLGQTFSEPMTMEQAISACGANWSVEERNLFIPNTDFGQLLMSNATMTAQEFMAHLTKVESHKSITRTDNSTNLGIVGKGYEMVQNIDAFEFVDLLTNGTIGKASIETCGVLGNGERIFVTAKFPNAVCIGNDDLIESYVCFTTSHDGSGAVTCMCTPIRVVCQNTLNQAMRNNTGKLYFKHTKNVGARMDLTNKENAKMAYAALKLQETYTKYFAESLEALAKVKLTDKEIEEHIVNACLTAPIIKSYYENGKSLICDDITTRTRNLVENVINSCHVGVGQDILEKGTGLWLVNGLTTYYQNDYDWKGNSERKFDAIIGGSVETKLNKLNSQLLKVA